MFFSHNMTNDTIVTHAETIALKHKTNKRYVVVINYSKPIDAERLYVVDLTKKNIILKSTVAHARNSGLIIPNDFSNENNSKKTSLGTYVTKNTYYGKYGYSLVVVGLDKTNSNAEKRSIVFHSNKLMKTKWSWGCFATPDSINTKLINLVKNGCLVSVQKL